MDEKKINLEGILSVVIPVYNEEETVAALLDRVLARPETGEIVLVDDASVDLTRQKIEPYLANPRIKFIKQDFNQGKGAAVIRGFFEATKPYVVIQDADFEYSPDDYPELLIPLVLDKADVVYGSRFMGTPGLVRYFRHEMGNKVLTFFSNCLSDIHLTDMETCYKTFKREVIQNLNLESKRFGIEVELTAKLAAARCLRIYETPVSYNPRRYNEGKKITWKDGIAALCHIVRFNILDDKSKFYKKPWNEILKGKL